MREALDALLLALGLLVVLWICVFGLAGALLSDKAGLSRLGGMLVGTALGPAGLLWLVWRAHRARRSIGHDLKANSQSNDSGAGFLL